MTFEYGHDAGIDMHVFLYRRPPSGVIDLRNITRLLFSYGFDLMTWGSWATPVESYEGDVQTARLDYLGHFIWVELKELTTPGGFYELQLHYEPIGGLNDDDIPWTEAQRDRFIDSLNALCALSGFELGFRTHLYAVDADEEMWRENFAANAIRDNKIAFDKILTYFMSYDILLGKVYTSLLDLRKLRHCPAWRIYEPSEDVICIYLWPLDPGCDLDEPIEGDILRGGRAWLKELYENSGATDR